MKELWKDVPGYEGLYQVSNRGRVKSLDRVSLAGKNLKGKVLKPGLGRNRQVLIATLSKNGKTKSFMVKTLVLRGFGTPVPHGARIKHINGEFEDCRLSNLEVVKSTSTKKQKAKAREYRRRSLERKAQKPEGLLLRGARWLVSSLERRS